MFVKSTVLIKTFLFLFAMLIFSSCKTTKNRFLNKAYHKTTTRYNWYFNALQSFNSAVNKIESTHKDDFNELLTIYPLGTEKDAQSAAPQLDKALKKCALAISKHSMLIKGQEHNSWIDDCYLLIGKAYFYKKEYIKSIEAFRLVNRQFEGQNSSYEAKIWLVKAFTETMEFSSAELVLEDVLSDEKFPIKLNKDLALAVAHYYIKQKNYDPAFSELLEAISLVNKKREKARYLYILAQLHFSQKNYSAATDNFSKVVRISPDYEMTFNSKINRARSFNTSSIGSEQIEGELLKMLKDDKNKEFLDVIYFGLAELSNRQGKIKEASSFYAKSVGTSINNDAQKALSSHVLADIYYTQQNYRNSQAYYDTAVAFMSANNDKFELASNRQKTLTELITNLNIIKHQDSIQRVALMPENERLAFIDKIIQKVEENEKQQRQLENSRRLENNFFNDPIKNNSFNRMNQNRGGGWYFDNPNTLSFGLSDFSRKWGNRKLEDDWRRSDKTTTSVEGAVADSSIEKNFDPKSRESYLRELPLTIEDISESNNKIVSAYFNAGLVYREKLFDLSQSIKTFKKLNERFPKNTNRPTVLYLLYRLNKDSDNILEASEYKKLLIEEFPNSDYAKLINNPDYADKLSQLNKELNQQYEKAYQLYVDSRFEDCISLCNFINQNDQSNFLFPDFELLKTIAKASRMNKKEYIGALSLIEKKYPQHSVSKSAKEILYYLQQQEIEASSTKTTRATYLYKPDAGHYFILLFKEFDLEVSIAKSTFSNYHAEYYRLERLNVSDLLFDEHTHMITVREFPNKSRAMSYYKSFVEGDVRGVFGENYDAFIIASPNFPTFFKNRDIDGYKKTFAQYYLEH
tara:strand:+ start:18717 stop:21296 length:2580 start_codon:yes stop_codon:yes gene_type:complete